MESKQFDTDVKRERKELAKQPRGQIGLPPWALLVFCVPFIGVGAAAILAGAGFLPLEKLELEDVPQWVMFLFGAAFLLLGLVVLVTTLQEQKRKAKAKKAPASMAYIYEHSWSQRWVHDDTGSAMRKTMSSIIILGGFLIPFHGILYYFIFVREEGGKWIAYIFLGIFDLILLLMLMTLIYLAIKRLVFGRRKVTFNSFPYYLGEKLTATFEGGKKLKNLNRIDIALRCVEEAVESRPSGSASSPRLTCYRVYEDKIQRPTDAHGRADISFDIPQALPGTQLTKMPPTYWELVIDAKLPGMDYQGVFLMPVYSP